MCHASSCLQGCRGGSTVPIQSQGWMWTGCCSWMEFEHTGLEPKLGNEIMNLNNRSLILFQFDIRVGNLSNLILPDNTGTCQLCILPDMSSMYSCFFHAWRQLGWLCKWQACPQTHASKLIWQGPAQTGQGRGRQRYTRCKGSPTSRKCSTWSSPTSISSHPCVKILKVESNYCFLVRILCRTSKSYLFIIVLEICVVYKVIDICCLLG